MALARVPLIVEPCPAYRLRVADVRLLRLDRGLAGDRVAAVLGMSQSNWSHWERGHRGEVLTVSASQLVALLDALDARPVGISRRLLASAA